MFDATDFVRALKQTTTEAVEAGKPSAVLFGVVKRSSPLEIVVEQKMTLTSAQLVLCRNVTEHEIQMTVDHQTQEHSHTHQITDSYTGGGSASEETHHHDYLGRKKVLVHNDLEPGEEVVLLRVQGGQKFLVVDRVVSL